MTYRASVISCSDRAAGGVYEDESGPILRDGLRERGYQVDEPVIVPDDDAYIHSAITSAIKAGSRVVVTTGGTGVGPRDITVKVTRDLLAFELPGLMEEFRRRSADKVPTAVLSRGLAGVIALADYPPALIVNAPGSRGGAKDTVEHISDLFKHVVDQLDGVDH